ncbi:MAG: helix-turn-helix domain-containing protein [Lentisphaerota bacterium]|jgi:HTH-type transcriptional regulator/antitoxin HipB
MKEAVTIGEIMRFHRKKSGLSQVQLAKLAGVGKTAVFDVEKGKESVQFNTLLKIMRVLNIKPDFTSPLIGEFNKLKEKEGK